MIYDLNKSTFDEFEYDVVIIGSGPAGISCALKFIRDDLKIAVVEGGGEDYPLQASEPYKGDTIGDKYFDLQFARLRFFGGTSNHWSGWCRPLDTHDFEYKTHQKTASWPISKSDLEIVNSFFNKEKDLLEFFGYSIIE